jgi:hypothetical protein
VKTTRQIFIRFSLFIILQKGNGKLTALSVELPLALLTRVDAGRRVLRSSRSAPPWRCRVAVVAVSRWDFACVIHKTKPPPAPTFSPFPSKSLTTEKRPNPSSIRPIPNPPKHHRVIGPSMSGYPYGGAGGGYGAPPPYGSSPAPSAPPYGEKPPKEGKTSSYGAPPQQYGSSGGGGYGAPPQSYGSGGGYGAPPPSNQPQSYASGGGGYGAPPPSSQPQPYSSGGYGAPPSGQSYGAPPPSSPYGAPPPTAAQPYGAAGGGYGSPFAALVPSAFPPGTDPNVVACFQAADRDGSGAIDDKELQSALSGYNQSFSLRTVHLLMYLFTNTNVRRIGKLPTFSPRFPLLYLSP